MRFLALFLSFLICRSYVMQDDAHVPVLTVKETFQFAAMLRLRRTSASSVEGEVEEMMKLLGIDHIADNFIGTDEHRTISRGQLRRVTIGCELIDSSSLIFLDEVCIISLLSSFMCFIADIWS